MVERSPDLPSDANRKDYLFFTGQRHTGNKEHMRQYLEWEIGLVGQLDADALFYFQSRGIEEEQARSILMKGFLNEVVLHEDGRALLGIET